MIRIDNNKVFLDLPSDRLYPFRNATAFLADGHEASVAFQQGRWDGYKYIVDHNGLMLGGHLPSAINYFGSYEVIDNRHLPIELGNWDNYIPATLGRFTLTKFQIAALKNLRPVFSYNVMFPRGVVNMAPNAGKSLVMAAALKMLLNIKPGAKVLFLFLQIELLDQLSELFTELLLQHTILLSDADMKKRKIVFDINKCQVLLTMAPTLHGKMQEDVGVFVEQCDCVMVDEVHLSTAPRINNILTLCNAWARWGFSGTPFDGKSDEQVNTLIAQFGPVLYTVTNKEMIEAGISAEPTVHVVNYDLFAHYVTYQDALKAIVNSMERNNIAYKWIKKNPLKRYLIVVEQIEHIDVLMKLLQEFNPLPMHAELSTKVRKDNLTAFKEYKCSVLIANATAKHGLNVKDINVIIYLRGGKSPVWLNQVIGRGLRLKTTGEQEFDVVDVYDNKHMLRPQSDQRLMLYQAEGYTIKLIKDSEI